MPSTVYKGLSYPTHLLKIRVVLLGIILFNAERNKPCLLRDEMILMHCSLPIKQYIYLIGIFRAPVVTQFIVKV